MALLLGLIIGAVSGVAQFWMLSKFTSAVTGGTLSKKTMIYGAAQFFVPIVVLVGCAFLLRDGLLQAGIGMALALICLALARFIKDKRIHRPKRSD